MNVERCEIIATLDTKTSTTCQEMDGKVFDMKGYEVGITAHPFLPNCRTCTAPYFDDNYGKRIVRDPKTGKTYYVPSDMKYEDWYKKHVVDKYGQQQADAMRKMALNEASDKQQYLRYKAVIGKDLSAKSFAEFQDLKYNRVSEWHIKQDNYFVRSRLQDGRWGSIINPEKQASHMKSTAVVGKSFFEDYVDVQLLFDKYAGTGKVEREISGKRTNKEVIIAKDFVGFAVNEDEELGTNTFKIHHSNKRTHIVPVSPI